MSSTRICRRVAIVEDEAMVAMLLEDMLTDGGHEVVAVTGELERATQLLSEISADVVILDVNLNGRQSYPLANTLASRGVRIIFSTGYGSAGLKEEWRTTPILQKPFQARDLERAMRQVFDGASA